MMAQSRAESTRDTYNYGQYLNQFPPNTIRVIREFERIQKRICRHKMSIMFNEICINEEMLPKYTYIYRGFNISSSHAKVSKIVHDASLLTTQHYKVRIKGKWINQKKGVPPYHKSQSRAYGGAMIIHILAAFLR